MNARLRRFMRWTRTPQGSLTFGVVGLCVIALICWWVEAKITWVWTLAAGISMPLAVWSLIDAWGDCRAIDTAIRLRRGRKYGPRWWVARGGFWSSLLWMAVFTDITTIGVLAILDLLDGWAGPALVAMVILLGAIQICDRFTREKTKEAIFV